MFPSRLCANQNVSSLASNQKATGDVPRFGLLCCSRWQVCAKIEFREFQVEPMHAFEIRRVDSTRCIRSSAFGARRIRVGLNTLP